MPHKKHHHKTKPEKCPDRVSGISIFNQVTVNAPVKQESETTAEKKEDGCTGCFKSLFGALKR